MDKKTLEIQIKLLANQALSQVKEFGDDIKNAADKAKGFTGDAAKISTSIKAMQNEAKRASNQMKLFGLSSSDLRNTTQNLKKTILELTDSGLKPESKEVQNLVEKYRELESQADKVEASEQGLFGVIGKIKNEIGSLAAVAAAVKIDKEIINISKSCLDVNNSFQKIKDEFGIMLGDVEAGIGLFNELQEFNFWTPFDIEQTSQAAKVLISAKVPLKDLTDYLTRFGDIAQGDAQNFQSYINAFSKASAKGKADMEVLNVYADQGVQILDALGQQLGKTSPEIVKMASEGKISFQDLDDALNSLASEGGLYYGTLEKAAMRLDAVQAGLEESIKSLKASFGQMLAPAISAVLTFFTGLVDAINESPILKGILAGAITAIVVLINVNAVKAMISLATKIWSAYAAQMGLNTAMGVAQPALLAVTAAAALATAGFVAYATYQQDAANEAANLAYETKKAEKAVNDLKTALGEKTDDLLDSELLNLERDLDIAEKKLKEVESKYNTENPAPIRRMPTQNISAMFDGTVEMSDFNPNDPSSWLGQTELEDAQKKVDELRETVRMYKEEIAEREFAKSLKEGNDILTQRDKLFEKTAEGQRAALEKQLAFAKSLYSLETVNPDGTKSGFNKAKTDAIVKDLEEQIKSLDDKAKKKLDEQLEKARKNVEEWANYGESEVSKLERQFHEAQKKLAENYDFLIENGAATEADKIKAVANLRMHYDYLEAEARKKAQKEYWQKEAEEAAKRISNGDSSAKNIIEYTDSKSNAELQASVEDTDLGALLSAESGMEALTAGIGSLITALVTCLMAVENVSKIVNWAGTIMAKVFEYIEPVINNILEPLVEVLETVGETVGQILVPLMGIVQLLSIFNRYTIVLKLLVGILQSLGAAFVWLNNEVIVPFGNKIIDIVNGVIDAINKIPFVNIQKIQKLNVIGDIAVEMAKEMEEAQELVKKKYERYKDRVEKLLDSQLDALRSQYELGLISRQKYEQQAEKYSQAADEKILEINKKMEEHLKGIEDGTRTVSEKIDEGFSFSFDDVQDRQTAQYEADPLDYKKKALYETTPQNYELARDAVTAISQAVQDAAPALAYYSASAGENDAGFSSQRSAAVLSSRGTIKTNRTARETSPVYVTVNVSGSVLAEEELVDSVYSGIVKGIEKRKYAPLGA